ncbi:MAG: hypothetical protein K8L99_26955 [Anaerolineae bacterium]|nr:hypothetical protein [Anaerolineae bacterium]
MMIKRTMIAVLLVVSLSSGAIPLSGQEAPEPTPEMPSLIVGDSCTPPCWFGMRAGETTAEEAFQILSANADLFWNDLIEVNSNGDHYLDAVLNLQPLLEEDGIHFYRKDTSFHGRISLGSILRLRDGVMSAMEIKPNVTVTLADALQRLGPPDVIRAGGYDLYYDLVLLYYREQHLIVELLADRETCEISDFFDVFRVEYIYYLTPTTYQEKAREWLTLTYYLPDDVMQRWIAGEVNISCSKAIQLLRH